MAVSTRIVVCDIHNANKYLPTFRVGRRDSNLQLGPFSDCIRCIYDANMSPSVVILIDKKGHKIFKQQLPIEVNICVHFDQTFLMDMALEETESRIPDAHLILK